jgi:proliferating cell nuclear antigen
MDLHKEDELWDSKYNFYITTVQTNAFKSLIESLNSLLIDCNFEIIPDSESAPGSIKILSVNNNISMLVHLRLLSKNFDIFRCKEKQVIGINMQNFYKIIKPITNTDTLTMYSLKEGRDKNRLHIEVNNKEKQQAFNYNIQIIDIYNEVLDISKVTFEAIVVMNSAEFQKICKDLNGLEARFITISLEGNSLHISCNGDIGNGDIRLSEAQESSNILINRQEGYENVNIKGKYELKNLILFTKCTNLCSSIEIYLKDSYPLLIKYTIASLGYLHLCLSPLIETDENF